jgi:hypothetical protein
VVVDQFEELFTLNPKEVQERFAGLLGRLAGEADMHAAVAARRLPDALRRPRIDVPKNAYRANGHNDQRPGLTIYLPGNGGLLAAVAMMIAGWDGAPDVDTPGFPRDGSWSVRWEGLRRMP